MTAPINISHNFKTCRFCKMIGTDYMTCSACNLSTCSTCLFTNTNKSMYYLNENYYCRFCYKDRKAIEVKNKSNNRRINEDL